MTCSHLSTNLSRQKSSSCIIEEVDEPVSSEIFILGEGYAPHLVRHEAEK